MTSKKGCYKAGCIGCACVVGIPVLVVVVLALVSWISSAPEQIESVKQDQPLPAAASSLPRPESGASEVAEPGRIVLDLTMGSFSIVPGPEGGSVRIEGEYDVAGYVLEESYESYGEIGWIYRVSFMKRGIGWSFGSGNNPNHLRIIVPRGVPVVIEGSISTGESRFELGGLWVQDVDLELGIGEHEVSFSEPLLTPMSGFRLASSIGELRVDSLGNASPASVEVRHRIGEVQLDLDGPWSRDADVDLSIGIGEFRLGLPSSEVGVVIERAHVRLGESDFSALQERPPPEEGTPTLTISLSGTLGQLSID